MNELVGATVLIKDDKGNTVIEYSMDLNKPTIELPDSTKNVVAIYIGFENMEGYTIPSECIQRLTFKRLEEKICEFSCHVVDNGKIDSSWGDNKSTFAQRVSEYNDITSITFICEDGTEYGYSTVWYYGENEEDWYKYDQINEYQKTTFHSYKEVEFSIAESNKVYTVEEVLSIGMIKETIFEDEFGIKYLSKDGALFLLGTTQPVYSSLDILNAQFTKVE